MEVDSDSVDTTFRRELQGEDTRLQLRSVLTGMNPHMQHSKSR